ncbi:MAG: hypothetical protein ACRD6I_04825 [Candidatus Acidiferrales bacterium]
MSDLHRIVEMYRGLAGGFGKAVPLARLGLAREEAERIFSVLDEDYHISRFFHFSSRPGARAFRINDFEHTHVSIDAEVETVL